MSAPQDKVGEASQPELVVGLGASAGGLEALSCFFRNMPGNSGLAFVVVTHQSPARVSLLAPLLAKQTSMPVCEATDGCALARDHVYVAPPGRLVTVINGRLHLAEGAEPPGQLPINQFFRSLATDQKDRGVGVVLSGTGTDGTLGLKEIKAQLGLAVVQAEDDAEFGGMPHSASANEHPDAVMPAAAIPGYIVNYLQRIRALRGAAPAAAESELNPEALSALFVLLRQRTGHDFSGYKESTLRRRIERRMALQQTDTVAQYFQYLTANPLEIDLLFGELLIGVTSFFRDPGAFESLAATLSEYIASKTDDKTLRVWVAGCSTGEEAYSVAILIREALDAAGRDLQVQVFATDLDPKAIDIARTGSYPLAVAGDISPERLKRFFVRQEHTFQVRKELRELLVFANQNLIEDAPFTRLDLMCCRNLLIYLDAGCQRRLFPIFHYVLKPGGTLFLGSSETVGQFTQLFDAVDKKWRIYRRKEVVGGTYAADIPAWVPEAGGPPPQVGLPPRRVEVGLSQLSERLLLRELVPPTVLIRERGEIVHIHGRTGMFLEPAPGQQHHANIYNMAREGLHLELAAALRQAAHEQDEVVRRNVRVKTNGHFSLVDLRVRRLNDPEPLRGLIRVSFEHNREVEAEPAPRALSGSIDETRVLELELQFTKESHQATIEELETANEELKSTNEELQSTNEELQSANEELETSKEELQSLNEELQTVNVELQSKVEELSRANDDMTNLLNATDIATIFLDNNLNIVRHTEQAKRVIRMIPSDVGRSIADLVSRLKYDQLVDDAREVLRTLAFKEVEVQGKGDDKWYLMRLLPYRTIENMIDGLVVTFVDITRVKLLQQSSQRLGRALEHSPVSVFGVDDTLHFVWSCGAVLGRDPSALVGRAFDEVFGVEYGVVRAALAELVGGRDGTRRVQLRVPLFGRSQLIELFVEARAGAEETSAATCVLALISSSAEAQ